MSRPRIRPFPTTRNDTEYLRRNRQAALASIEAAADRLVKAISKEAREQARMDMQKFERRLEDLREVQP